MGERTSRLAGRLAAAVGLALALYYAVFGGEYSLPDVWELAATRDAVASRVDSLHAVAEALERRADSLATDGLAIERVARERYGFVRDGERLYRFLPPPESREARPESEEPGRDGSPP